MDLLMKLLIKPMWRGVFQIYPFDFKRKLIALTYYPSLSAILQKNPLKKAGSFCLYSLFQVGFDIAESVQSAPLTGDNGLRRPPWSDGRR